MSLDQKSCKWCAKPRAKYSCPKCAAPYCSLQCYRDKGHEGCTESFYKDQVEESVKAQKADDETKREMQRIVQRYHDDIANDTIDALTLDSNQGDTGDSDETDSGGEEPSLAERLGGIDLSGELDDSAVGAIWHQMTEEERAGFVDLLGGHGIESIATPWRSWWCKADEPKVTLIDDNGEAAKKDNAEQSPVPPVLDIGAPVTSLTRKVHPSVLFQLAQITLAYVYTMRHLNGEARGHALAAAFASLEKVAPLLSHSTADVYQSTHEALIVGFSGIDEALDGSAKCALLDDILAIYSDPLYVAAMISDMYRIVTDILAGGASTAHHLKNASVKRAERRVFFLASIVKQMQGAADPWRFMAVDVAMLRQRYASDMQTLERELRDVPPRVGDAGAVAADDTVTKPRIQPL